MNNRNLSLVLVMFLITFLSNIAYSQVGNTIVDTNSVWFINMEYVIENPIPINYYVHLKGDTIIDLKHYTKVWTNNDLSLTDDMELYGLIREENQKTYFRYFHSPTNAFSNESLQYDFSLPIGDSIRFIDYWFTNIMIDSVEVNGNKYKEMKLSDRYDTISLIEKIGNIEGGLLYTMKLFNDGCINNLLCYYNNDKCLYTNPEFNYCFLSLDNPIKTEEEEKTIIYPNPVKDYLNIESKEIISKIEVLDIEGRLLISKENINNINYSTNLDSLSKGVYILKIIYKNGKIASYKLLKE